MTTHRPLLVREKLILAIICILILLGSRLFAASYHVNSTDDRPIPIRSIAFAVRR